MLNPCEFRSNTEDDGTFACGAMVSLLPSDVAPHVRASACEHCLNTCKPTIQEPGEVVRTIARGLIGRHEVKAAMIRKPKDCTHRRPVVGKIECAIVSELAKPGYLWNEFDCMKCCRSETPSVDNPSPALVTMLLGDTVRKTLTRKGLNILKDRVPRVGPLACKHLGSFIRSSDEEGRRSCASCSWHVCRADVYDEVRPDTECMKCLQYVIQEIKSSISSPAVGPPMDVVKYNAETHGFGDLLTVLWIAEGAKAQGKKITFYATKEKADIVRAFGHEATNAHTNAIDTYKAYGEVELGQDRGKNGRIGPRARALGFASDTYARPSYTLQDQSMQWADRVLQGNKKPVALLFPTVEWKPREWPRAYFVDLANELEALGWFILTLLRDNDKTVAGTPRYFYGQPWMNVMALVARASVVIANDSGPAWLGGTMGVQTVAVTGPTNPAVFKELPEVECVQSGLECVGCHFGKPYRKACDVGCQSLMLTPPSIVLDRVLSAAGKASSIHDA